MPPRDANKLNELKDQLVEIQKAIDELKLSDPRLERHEGLRQSMADMAAVCAKMELALNWSTRN